MHWLRKVIVVCCDFLVAKFARDKVILGKCCCEKGNFSRKEL